MDNKPQYRRVTDLTAQELALYTERREAQLLHYYEPGPGLFLAESPNVITRALQGGYEPISFLIEDRLMDNEICGQFPDVPVYMADTKTLNAVPGFSMTRGMLSLMRRRELPSARSLCRELTRIAVLEDVVNPTNVGAIFRSAAALGVEGILVTPGCADPLYRRAARVSMGTVFQIPWTYFPKGMKPAHRLEMLHEQGFQTAAMALSDRAVSLGDPRLREEHKLAVIMGTESEGLCRETMEGSSYIVRIPMQNEVDSLNVAAASAVAFWELFRTSSD